MASAVCTPWPISLWFIASSTPPSPEILIQPFRPTSPSTTGSVATPPRRGRGGITPQPTSSTPATPVPVSRKARRFTKPPRSLRSLPPEGARPGLGRPGARPAVSNRTSFLRGSCGADGGANPRIGAAAADVGDRGVDLGVAWRALGREQSRGRHQHAALAVAALRHLVRQ